jgi:hypothetical protein
VAAAWNNRFTSTLRSGSIAFGFASLRS